MESVVRKIMPRTVASLALNCKRQSQMGDRLGDPKRYSSKGLKHAWSRSQRHLHRGRLRRRRGLGLRRFPGRQLAGLTQARPGRLQIGSAPSFAKREAYRAVVQQRIRTFAICSANDCFCRLVPRNSGAKSEEHEKTADVSGGSTSAPLYLGVRRSSASVHLDKGPGHETQRETPLCWSVVAVALVIRDVRR